MRKRKNAIEELPPYHLNPDISFVDLYLKKQFIAPGTLLSVKNDRRVYVYQRMCYNSRLDKTWIDLRSQANGDWLSVYPSKIKGVYVAKRSRAKKQ